jgi:hypothetical protein
MRLRDIVRQHHRRVLEDPLDQCEHQIPREGEMTHGVSDLGLDDDVVRR